MHVAYSYLRFSTPEQLKGTSLKRQGDKAETFAARHGLQLDRHYSFADLGVSAYRGKNRTHGALARFLALVDGGRIEPGSVLIVENFDRLSRDKVDEAYEAFRGILKRDIRIGMVSDDRIYDRSSLNDPAQLMYSIMNMARANEESARKADLTLNSWEVRRREGRKGSLCPAWLRLAGEEYVVIPERADIIREIFGMAARGMGGYRIARELSQRAIPPLSTKIEGKPVVGRSATMWRASAVVNLLNNRAVLGYFQPRNAKKEPVAEEIAGYFPTIIDQLTWDRVRSTRRRLGNRSGRKGDTFVNLFTGFGYCAGCGAAMKYHHGNTPERRYLVCSSYLNRAGCGTGGYIPYKPLEEAVLDGVVEFKLSDLFCRPEAEADLRRVENDIARLEAAITSQEKRQARLTDLLADLEPEDDRVEDYNKALATGRGTIRGFKEALRQQSEEHQDLTAQRDARIDGEGEVARLRAELATAEVDRVGMIRTKLHAALKSFISGIIMDGENGVIDVILANGARAYRFERTTPKSRKVRREVLPIGYVDVAQLLGDKTVREVFTTKPDDVQVTSGVYNENPDAVASYEVIRKVKQAPVFRAA
jgi:DNA invertase Pin-like site-specific DNA recombinase